MFTNNSFMKFSQAHVIILYTITCFKVVNLASSLQSSSKQVFFVVPDWLEWHSVEHIPPPRSTVHSSMICKCSTIRLVSKYGCVYLKREHHLSIITDDALEVCGISCTLRVPVFSSSSSYYFDVLGSFLRLGKMQVLDFLPINLSSVM